MAVCGKGAFRLARREIFLRAIEADHSGVGDDETRRAERLSLRVLARASTTPWLVDLSLKTVTPGCCLGDGRRWKEDVARSIHQRRVPRHQATADGIREGQPGEMRIYVSENVGLKGSNGCGQAISAVHSFPEVMVKRKLCSLTIAATRLNPSPRPPLLRLLSER